VLGHLDEKEVTSERLIEIENEADAFATDRVLKVLKRDEEEYPGESSEMEYLGILCALCSLTFIAKNFKGGDHPDVDDRISKCLHQLGFDQDHYSWGFATWAIMEWMMKLKTFIRLPKKYVNKQQWLEHFLDEIKKTKASTR
jgi:hypothetical protein